MRLRAEQALETGRARRDGATHAVEVRLDGVLALSEGLGDRSDRLLPQVLQVEDPPLERREVVGNELLAMSEDPARIDGLVRGRGGEPRVVRDVPEGREKASLRITRSWGTRERKREQIRIKKRNLNN